MSQRRQREGTGAPVPRDEQRRAAEEAKAAAALAALHAAVKEAHEAIRDLRVERAALARWLDQQRQALTGHLADLQKAADEAGDAACVAIRELIDSVASYDDHLRSLNTMIHERATGGGETAAGRKLDAAIMHELRFALEAAGAGYLGKIQRAITGRPERMDSKTLQAIKRVGVDTRTAWSPPVEGEERRECVSCGAGMFIGPSVLAMTKKGRFLHDAVMLCVVCAAEHEVKVVGI